MIKQKSKKYLSQKQRLLKELKESGVKVNAGMETFQLLEFWELVKVARDLGLDLKDRTFGSLESELNQIKNPT